MERKCRLFSKSNRHGLSWTRWGWNLPRGREKELRNEPQLQGIYLRVCQNLGSAILRRWEGISCLQGCGRGKKGTREPQESMELPGKGDKRTMQAGNSLILVTDKMESVPRECDSRAVIDFLGFKL